MQWSQGVKLASNACSSCQTASHKTKKHGFYSKLHLLYLETSNYLIAKCLRRVVNNNGFGQIPTKNSEIFHVISVHKNAIFAEKSVPIIGKDI